jgi:hypothetical protein
MRNVTLQIEDREGAYCVGPIPPQPDYLRATGKFERHKDALRFAHCLAIVHGWKVKDISEAGQ